MPSQSPVQVGRWNFWGSQHKLIAINAACLHKNVYHFPESYYHPNLEASPTFTKLMGNKVRYHCPQWNKVSCKADPRACGEICQTQIITSCRCDISKTTVVNLLPNDEGN